MAIAYLIVRETVDEFGRLDVLVNHAGTQTPVESPEEISSGELSSYYTGEVMAPIGGETLPG